MSVGAPKLADRRAIRALRRGFGLPDWPALDSEHLINRRIADARPMRRVPPPAVSRLIRLMAGVARVAAVVAGVRPTPPPVGLSMAPVASIGRPLVHRPGAAATVPASRGVGVPAVSAKAGGLIGTRFQPARRRPRVCRGNRDHRMAPLSARVGVSAGALIAANLVPLVAVALGWWSTYEVVLLFWAENVVIGLLQLLRFATVAALAGKSAALGVAVFFALHYGMFTFVHGVFVATLFAPGDAEPAEALALLLSPEALLFGVGALAASHLVSFAVNFVGGGEYRRIEPAALMMTPYGRVVVLHLAIIIGGALTMALKEPAIGLVVLVLLKIGLDLRAHMAEHQG